MNLLKTRIALGALTGVLIFAQQLLSVDIWPDKVEQTVKIEEAARIATIEIGKVEDDPVYCLNATLLNGEDGTTRNGFWLMSYRTELGDTYSVAVRMDRMISVKKIKKLSINSQISWPDTVTPPIPLEAAIIEAQNKLTQKDRLDHYCLNVTLVSGSANVHEDGMWNFVFQTSADDPRMVNVKMDGKVKTKKIDKIKQYGSE
ncbi:MAG: hypothetical protein MI748_08025 [Opitutales bacterium]|nr:hypothetical protein [Opitutales bacterium]